jgi:glycosyltransferase involved in cell wall biosynthesis
MKGKVLILLATHNRAHLIGKTLDSVIGQTYRNWECIIVDDFSSDTTYEVVQQYIKEDSRFFYFLKPPKKNKGLSASRNYGLELAKNSVPEFIQFFDDDDLMHPQKIELQVKSLIANPSAQFTLCGSKNFYKLEEIEWDEIQDRAQSPKLSLGEAYLTGEIKFVAQVPLFRYNYATNFSFDEDLFYAEEWTLFSMDFLLNNPMYTVLVEVLFYRRKHENSITESNDDNFQIRKTIAIVGVKVYSFLTANKLHTKITLLYFARQFLLYRYDSKFLAEIGGILKSMDKIGYWRFRFAILVHWVSRKFILKALKFRIL